MAAAEQPFFFAHLFAFASLKFHLQTPPTGCISLYLAHIKLNVNSLLTQL